MYETFERWGTEHSHKNESQPTMSEPSLHPPKNGECFGRNCSWHSFSQLSHAVQRQTTHPENTN
ncbi:hypothetical protein RBSWK_03494 [Rhodopirellula baltica SWK14]|uniref:Uncharacterized protein n=1 Tax=Rhodopirellula baltica SWK14 TaxID=993516 RepID=L7CEX4_RHOBT|nr:hypothetical protein RBSWK_03494 [Rhodopirellula baltica SWK14]